METINDVMHLMNKLFFKACLKDGEYEDFEIVGNKSIDEFHSDGVELLNRS